MPSPPILDEIAWRLRVLIVAGVPVGVLVAGVGSRLAMLVLRLTSPDGVIGVTSDDGFTIGRFTLGGTYNLLVLGAAVGIIGAGAYMAVAPWLLGPRWFRHATVAAASGAVVGSMLVHEDGIDFKFLKPTWLAIGLFVALPAAFGGAIGPAVEWVSERSRASRLTRRQWVFPVVAVALFPPTIFLVAVAAAALAVSVPFRMLFADRSTPFVIGVAVRLFWLFIAGAGVVALVRDIDALV